MWSTLEVVEEHTSAGVGVQVHGGVLKSILLGEVVNLLLSPNHRSQAYSWCDRGQHKVYTAEAEVETTYKTSTSRDQREKKPTRQAKSCAWGVGMHRETALRFRSEQVKSRHSGWTIEGGGESNPGCSYQTPFRIDPPALCHSAITAGVGGVASSNLSCSKQRWDKWINTVGNTLLTY